MTIVMDRETLELDALFAEVEQGNDILITREGESFAQIKPILSTPLAAPRKPGIDKNKLVVPDDILAPLPDAIIDEFYK